jgi:hypothetical protein
MIHFDNFIMGIVAGRLQPSGDYIDLFKREAGFQECVRRPSSARTTSTVSSFSHRPTCSNATQQRQQQFAAVAMTIENLRHGFLLASAGILIRFSKSNVLLKIV